ncbi:MAG: AAA family ATPase [bacterium]
MTPTPPANALAALKADCGTPGQTASGYPKIVRASDFVATPIKRPAEVIRGVLYQGGKMVFGGPSKAYKTWDLIDLGLAVSTGGEWLGFGTTQGLTLYVNLELMDFSAQHRLREVARARECKVPDNLRVWNLRGHVCPLAVLLPELLSQIAGDQYSLIIVDPIYKTMAGRDENDAGAVGEVCNEIEAFAVKTGAAIAFGSHFAKGNASQKNAIDRISGSGVYARDPDAILTATPLATDGAFSLELTLRDFAPVEPFGIRWEYPRMLRDETLDPGDLKPAKVGREPENTVQNIMQHIGTSPLSTGVWKKLCVEESGMSARTFYRLRKKAKDARLVFQDGETWMVKKVSHNV